MAISLERGLKRLGIALSAPWVAWWAYQAWLAHIAMQRQHDAEATMARAGLTDVDRGGTLARLREAFNHDVTMIPLLPIGLLLAYWVWRGFQRRN